MWCAISQAVRSVIEPFQRLQGGLDVVGRVDRLAHVVQEGRQQELLVVRPLLPRQLEDLQAVIERIPLGVILGALLHPFQRLEQHPESKNGSIFSSRASTSDSRSMSGYSSRKQRLQLGDRGPLDRLAGDRALEDVVHLVLGVERQLEIVAIVRRGCE